jgi:hypothetical protein
MKANASRLVALLIATLACPALAIAADPSSTMSRASSLSAVSIGVAGGTVIAGSLSAVALGASATVTSLQAVGESTVVVLTSTSSGVQASVRLATDAVRASGIAVGSGVVCLVTATGTMVSLAGRAVIFVPNELGLALVHSAPISSAY